MVLLAVGSLCGSFLFSVGNYFIENQGGFFRKLPLWDKFLKNEIIKRESIIRASMKRPSHIRASRRESQKAFIQEIRRSSLGYGATKNYGNAVGVENEETRLTPKESKLGNISFTAEDLKSDSEDLEDEKSINVPCYESHSILDNEDLEEVRTIIEAEFKESKSDANVGIAIWLGILIDSFPESLVIGVLAAHGISLTFIIGVFLSNLPEALSSSVIMRRGGLTPLKIIMMWVSITLITGLGAVIGVAIFRGEMTESKYMAELFIEGLAAGAMLVMIAETALPEAFHHAGKLVGFSTLFGFLVAFAIKLAEEP